MCVCVHLCVCVYIYVREMDSISSPNQMIVNCSLDYVFFKCSLSTHNIDEDLRVRIAQDTHLQVVPQVTDKQV